MSGEIRYTIEQIDLLRRLHKSGISQDEIIHALDTMDSLERQHGEESSCGRASGASRFSPSSANGLEPATPFGQELTTAAALVENNSAGPKTANHLGLVNVNSGYPTANNSENDINDPEVDAMMRKNMSVMREEIKGFLTERGITQHYVSHCTGISQSYISQFLCQGIKMRDATMRLVFAWYAAEKKKQPLSVTLGVKPDPRESQNIFGEVNDEEVDRMLSLGVSRVREEIKGFMDEHCITQNHIARQTGISQGCLSQFLAHVMQMKELTLRKLVKWYLYEKTEISKQPKGVSALSGYRRPPGRPPKNSAYTKNGGDDSWLPGNEKLKKKERFAWKDTCIGILENYFENNPYPDENQREKIAQVCNSLMTTPGEELQQDLRATSTRVYNWFSNHRKRRISNASASLDERASYESSSSEVSIPAERFLNSDIVDQSLLSLLPDNGKEIKVRKTKHFNDTE